MGAEDGDLDIGPTHALMAFPEPERSQYCIDVVKALADSMEEITEIKGKLKQAKRVKAFMKDLREKKDEILPVLFYMIKPQFRETFAELFEKFSGYVAKDGK